MNPADQKLINAVFHDGRLTDETPAQVLFSFKRREAILEATVFAADQFLHNDNWQDKIANVLERLGHATIVSRVYLFDHHIDDQNELQATLLGEWIKPGVQSTPMVSEINLERNGFGRWIDVLSRGEVIFSPVEDLPEEERVNFAEDGIRSVIAVPIFVGDIFWGIMGFNDHHQARDWSPMEIDVLKIAAATLGAAIDRARSQEALLQAQRFESVGMLAGGIAHDFNNLLTAILGQASIALHKLPGDHPAVKNIKRVKQSAERAGDLTRQLLAYAGKQQTGKEQIDLVKLIRENIDFLPSTLPPNVSIKATMPPHALSIEGDRSQLQQVIMNLIINAGDALKEVATRRPGVVEIRLNTAEISLADPPQVFIGRDHLKPGLYVAFEVVDNGIGMSPATVERIFDPFFTTKATGHGLGLSAVLGIIKAHDGGMQVESEEGVGTTFRVLLPLVSQEVYRIYKSDDFELDGVALIIDDDHMAADATAGMLELNGMSVLIANSGIEGLQYFLANQERIDLVILDLQMPDMNGAEVYQQLQAFSADLKVLFISGYGESILSDLNRLQGEINFLRKPFTVRELKSAIFDTLNDPN